MTDKASRFPITRRFAQNRPGMSRLVGFVALGAGLLWLVIARTLPATLASTAPDSALMLQPNDPRILLKRARAEVDSLVSTASLRPAAEVSADGLRGESHPGKVSPSPDAISGMARIAERIFHGDGGAGDKQTLASEVASPSGKGRRVSEYDGALRDRVAATVEIARRSIAASPFNAGGLTVLGQLADFDQDPGLAGPLMRAAARLSIRESYAVYWLLQRSLDAGDYANVIERADSLLRTRSRSVPLVVPVLAKLVEQNQATPAVAKLLASNPPWRASFFAALPQNITDARTPLHLFLGLHGTAAPPSESELSSYLDFLMTKNLYELAYYSWLEFLPREKLMRISPMNNGGFETRPSGVPFDWTLPYGSGFMAEIRSAPETDGGHALSIAFTHGRAEFAGVSQTTLLGPGSYTISGRYKGILVGRRGLVWRVNCLGKGTIGQSIPLSGDFPEWNEFTFTVTIPPEGCRAQQIRLDLDARSASEKLVSGSMWFDDLTFVRVTRRKESSRLPDL